MRRLNVQTKMLGFVGIMIVIVMSISTLVHIGNSKRDYLETIGWRSEALAQSLVDDVTEMFQATSYAPERLTGLSLQCEQLYTPNQEKHVAHIAIIRADGVIAAHNDAQLVGTSIESETILEALEQQAQITVLDGAIYHTLVPIFATQDKMYIGSVDVGFPKYVLDASVGRVWRSAFVLFVVFLALACASMSFLLHLLILKPIKKLIAVGDHLAEGNIAQTTYTTGQVDEIARLGMVFYRLTQYLQHLAEVASQIATGALHSRVQTRSRHDILGNAVQEVLRYLNEVIDVATKLSEGNLSETVQVRSENDAFGKAIRAMTNGLRKLMIQIRDSTNEIADTGMTISDVTEQDIHLAERVHTVTENMMGTMQEMGVSVEEVAHNMNTLSTSVQETSDSVLMITASITHIAGNASDLTKRSHQTIESMEGAMDSLEDVVKSTDISEQLSQETIQDALAGQEAFEQVMTSMHLIEETIATSVNVITQFERRSQDIDTILDVIREITEQTSLLALNASIIAAQAGEHGKSFGVVAEEIKELAQGVGTSTKDIASILNTLQKDTRMVVKTIHCGAESVREGTERMQDAQQTLTKIIQSARRSSNVVSEIAEALRKVMRTSRDVVKAMEEVSEMTDDFTIATNEQEMSTEQINNAVTQINTMASQIRQVTDRQLTGVHQMLDAANDVTALIDQNLESAHQIAEVTELLASQADLLVRSVDRFKFGIQEQEAQAQSSPAMPLNSGEQGELDE